jgi:DNA-binding GntR family transcriptional regulator
VREISLDEAIEITEVRRLLEGHQAARAAERVTGADAAALRGIIKDMRIAVERSEFLRYSDLNGRLHAAIRDISAHETCARLLRQLRDQTVRHQFSLSLVPGRPAVSLPQHEAIVTAVTARDPAAAEQAMRSDRMVAAAYRLTMPASCASSPACVRLAHPSLTSIRDT